MMIQPIPDFPALPICSLRDPPLKGPFAVLTEARSDEAALECLSRHFGTNLVTSEVWRNVLPGSGVLISSAISGGTLEGRFRHAAAACPQRCWLLVEPISERFPLPCLTGIGTPIPVSDHSPAFYSEALCCMYTHAVRDGTATLTLWDTEETLRRKLELAKAAGFLGYTVRLSG